MKNQFFHARQPREEIFEFCSCSGLIFMTDFWNFGRLFLIGETFFQKNFWLKSLLMVGTLLGLMWSWIKKPWMTSNLYTLMRFWFVWKNRIKSLKLYFNFLWIEIPIFTFLVDCVWSLWSSATCGDFGTQGRYKLIQAKNSGNERHGDFQRKWNQIKCPTDSNN